MEYMKIQELEIKHLNKKVTEIDEELENLVNEEGEDEDREGFGASAD